jgi:hypothetical protein
MTSTLERPAVMSVANSILSTEEEVKTMTATTTLDCPTASRRARPHGLDRLLMRVSLATLLWARRHADRTALSREQLIREHEVRQSVQRREHDAALLVARVR